jgi:hypothetical protein
VDRCRFDPEFVVLLEVDRYVVCHLTVVGYFREQSVKMDELLLFHEHVLLTTEGL